MNLESLTITPEQEQYCRKWLRQFYKADLQLTDKMLFPESILAIMLKMEIRDRRRKYVIDRIERRYQKLRRVRERKAINNMLGYEHFIINKE
jgi:hypothetical protein